MDPQTVSLTTLSITTVALAHAAVLALILTDDLITRGHNYSFAVAVTDSTGQRGPWSDQLLVTYDGMNLYSNRSRFLVSFYRSSWYCELHSAVTTNKH